MHFERVSWISVPKEIHWWRNPAEYGKSSLASNSNLSDDLPYRHLLPSIITKKLHVGLNLMEKFWEMWKSSLHQSMEYHKGKTTILRKQIKTYKSAKINVWFVLEEKRVFRWVKTQFYRFLLVCPSQNQMAKQILQNLHRAKYFWRIQTMASQDGMELWILKG